MTGKIQVLCTSETMTIYWDKQTAAIAPSTEKNAVHLDDAEETPLRSAQRQVAPSILRNAVHLDGAEGIYAVLLDGSTVGATDKTHFTLEDLEPDREYRVEVWRGQDASFIGENATSLGGAVDDDVVETCGSGLELSEHTFFIGMVFARTEKLPSRIDVTAAGAVGDGRTMNTEILQRIFDDCAIGEEVYFPAGIYRTGALRLHSNMALYLEEGAVLQGTDEPEDYLPYIHSRFEGTEMECYSSLLNLGTLDHASWPNCENVRIYGKGTIASGGQTLGLRVIERETQRMKDYLAANQELVASCETDHTIPGRLRPRLINLSNCKNVRISGLTLENGACWNVHMIYCDSIVTDHCTFRSEGVWNGDGWDPDSSTNCTLFASEFFTGDDAVAIKSGKNPEGNVIARPCAHIRVFDCISHEGHGICMGSEMSGGIEDVRIWDCDLERSMSGLEIKATKKRGGYVRDICVQDCVIPRVMMHSVGYNDDGIPAPTPPKFSDCLFERLVLTGRYLDTHGDGTFCDCDAIELVGFDVPGYEIQNVTFRDISLTGGPQSIKVSYCVNLRMEN